MNSLLKVDLVSFAYRTRSSMFGGSKLLPAVDGVSFDVRQGEIVGLVGESGSGKSTVGKLVMGDMLPSAGVIERIVPVGGPERRPFAQMVFQDTGGSLDPRWSVARSVAEPLNLAGCVPAPMRKARVIEALERVGLNETFLDRYPGQLSGGQRQRVVIARAIISNPHLLVCDEAVSALDVSIQKQILDILVFLNDSTGMAFLFITHDLRVVASLCSRVLVMRKGRIVEAGKTAEVLLSPRDRYTRELVEAVPLMPRFDAISTESAA